jgi:WD40 repeat protein
MPEPDYILAIDFGTTTSAAILVGGATDELIEEPSGHGRTWPSTVSWDGDKLVVGTTADKRKRRHAGTYRAEFKQELGRDAPIRLGERSFAITVLITELLMAMKGEAERIAGGSIDRAVLTIPASYHPEDCRRDLMIEAGTAAGFRLVELLTEPVAAALAPAAGRPITPGTLLLVCDFGGGTFDTALVQVHADGNEVLGYRALDTGHGGRDIDDALSAILVDSAGPEVVTEIASDRGRLLLKDAARGIKHDLSNDESADADFGSTDIELSATRKELNTLTRPLLRGAMECVRLLLDACSVSLDDVDCVLTVGGVSRMPIVQETVGTLGRPLREAKVPELAVVQGAARFAARAANRVAYPVRQRVDERPLRWRIPDGGSATLLEWLVSAGDSFTAGQVLAHVRIGGAIWDLRADDTAGRITGLHARRGAAIFDRVWLATAETVDATVRDDPEPVLAVEISGRAITALAFSPDGDSFVGTLDEGVGKDKTRSAPAPSSLQTLVRNLDVLAEAIAPTSESRAVRWVTKPGYASCITQCWFKGSLAVAYSRDGRLIATGGTKGKATIADTRGNEQATFECGTPVTGVSFGPDGKRLATASECLHVWDIEAGTATMLRAGAVADVRFSPADDLVMAAYPADGVARVMDARRGRVATVRTEVECRNSTGFVAVSPDGARFAAGRDENAVGVWDTVRGDLVASLPHVSVRAAAFSKDGITCATGSADGYALLWNIATGEELARVEHGDKVNAVAFSPDGKFLGTAGADGKARIWRVA